MVETTAHVGRRLWSIGTVAVLLLALLAGSSGTATAHHSSSSTSTGPSYSMEDDFLALLNRARAAEGRTALRRVNGVDNVAREWAHTMAVDGQLKHRPSLATPFDGAWRGLGENVGVGYSAGSLHRAFMNSPGHHANIMGDWDYVGIGVALAGAQTWVAVNFVRGDPDTRSTYDRDPLHGSYATGAGARGPYNDIGDDTFERAIKQLDAAGVAVSCASARYCSGDPLRRSEMAALLTDALDLPPAREGFRDVPSGHLYAAEIGALARAGITLGCNPPANDRYCPEEPVTRSQMASFIARALDLSPAREPFRDVTSSNVHHRNIGALARSGVTLGCNPPANDRYCPGQDVTKGQMAAFVARGVDL